MNTLKRWLLIAALGICLLGVSAFAQETLLLEMSAPIEGQITSEQGDCLAYSLPQTDGLTDPAKAINGFYQELAASLEQEWKAGDQENRSITFEQTYHDAHYLCFVMTDTVQGGNMESKQIFADTFALDGLYAGQKISLSQLLGLEQADGQTSLADRLAHQLVWQIVEQQSQNADSDYLDGITSDSICAVFDPEQDFYLDGDGNVVFYIQPGLIAGEIAGVLLYPFAPAELLSAL